MPSIQAPKTEKIYLPSYKDLPEDEQGYVVIKDRLLLADMGAVTEAKTDMQRTVAILAAIITEWNFDDSETKEILSITIETVDWLRLEDKVFLSELIVNKLDLDEMNIDSVQKKTSIAISQPSITEENQTPPIQSQEILKATI